MICDRRLLSLRSSASHFLLVTNLNNSIGELAMSRIAKFILMLLCLAAPGSLLADGPGSNRCGNLSGHVALKQALEAAVAADARGLNFEMWATIVDRAGVVCEVAFSGPNRWS